MQKLVFDLGYSLHADSKNIIPNSIGEWIDRWDWMIFQQKVIVIERLEITLKILVMNMRLNIFVEIKIGETKIDNKKSGTWKVKKKKISKPTVQ